MVLVIKTILVDTKKNVNYQNQEEIIHETILCYQSVWHNHYL